MIILAVHSESHNIVSFRLYFQSKGGGGTFLRHPVLCAFSASRNISLYCSK